MVEDDGKHLASPSKSETPGGMGVLYCLPCASNQIFDFDLVSTSVPEFEYVQYLLILLIGIEDLGIPPNYS